MEVAPAEIRRDRGRQGFPLLPVLAGLAAAAAVLPLGGIVVAALSGEGADIAARDVWRYAFASAGLTLLVGAITALLGTTAAWLVVMYRFPGRRFFSWALALPLAAPAFALAYAYADLFDVAGPVRIWSRASLGFDMPIEMRSFPGAAFILSCAFYPYVFLAMRAAFLGQAASMLEAARVLGSTTTRALFRVALPLARPALAAGVALVMMETLADYGALQFLSVQTLTTGVIRAWSVYGSTAGAAQFALPLLGAAGLLLWLERTGRADRRFVSTAGRWRTQPMIALRGLKAIGALAFCLILLIAGLLLPVGWLAWKSLGVSPEWPRLMQASANTLALGIASAVTTVTLATALALGAQRMPLAARLASLGYATPGAFVVHFDGHVSQLGAFGTYAFGARKGVLEAYVSPTLAMTVPPTIKIVITGTLQAGVMARDVFHHLVRVMGPSSCAFRAVELAGPVIDAMSIEGRQTLCGQAMFLGANTMLIAPDAQTLAYTKPRAKLDLAPVYPDADAVYERVVTVDVSELEPIVVIPPSPANTRDLRDHVGLEVHAGYLGSCASGRLEDLRVAAQVLRGRQVKPGFQLHVVPTSQVIMAQAAREGLLETAEGGLRPTPSGRRYLNRLLQLFLED